MFRWPQSLLKMDGKEYLVRFIVQRKMNESGVHSTMVTNVDVYENPAIASSNPPDGWRSVVYDRIVDAKLGIYFDKNNELGEKFKKTYQEISHDGLPVGR